MLNLRYMVIDKPEAHGHIEIVEIWQCFIKNDIVLLELNITKQIGSRKFCNYLQTTNLYEYKN